DCEDPHCGEECANALEIVYIARVDGIASLRSRGHDHAVHSLMLRRSSAISAPVSNVTVVTTLACGVDVGCTIENLVVDASSILVREHDALAVPLEGSS